MSGACSNRTVKTPQRGNRGPARGIHADNRRERKTVHSVAYNNNSEIAYVEGSAKFANAGMKS